nr:uncharacterized protein LOC127338765 [Lolium perenne]
MGPATCEARRSETATGARWRRLPSGAAWNGENLDRESPIHSPIPVRPLLPNRGGARGGAERDGGDPCGASGGGLALPRARGEEIGGPSSCASDGMRRGGGSCPLGCGTRGSLTPSDGAVEGGGCTGQWKAGRASPAGGFLHLHAVVGSAEMGDEPRELAASVQLVHQLWRRSRRACPSSLAFGRWWHGSGSPPCLAAQSSVVSHSSSLRVRSSFSCGGLRLSPTPKLLLSSVKDSLEAKLIFRSSS